MTSSSVPGPSSLVRLRPLVLGFMVLLVHASAGAFAQSRYPAPENMQPLHIALLLKGPNYTIGPSTPDLQKLQEAHLAHITKMAKDGAALIAGPMGDDGDLRGIILLKAASPDAARALEADDPAVKAGRLRIEIVSYVTPANWFSFGPVTDDLPMRQFVFGFLKAGPNRGGSTEETARVQDDHLANLWAMRESGALVLAGSTVNGGDREGVFALAVDSLDKAKALLDQDPAVKSGRLVIEMHPWFAVDRVMKGK